MYEKLIAELRQHHCDAREDDTQEVCEECAYDVIIADKSVPSGIASVCVCGLMHRAADAIEALSVVVRAQKAVLDKFPRWIPVTERLPEQEKQVLVTGIEAIGNVQIYGVKQLDGDVWRPTSAPSCYWEHWMPLPEPPKEET